MASNVYTEEYTPDAPCATQVQRSRDMSIVKLLGFETLGCGCVVGHYRDAGTIRVVTYVEEKSVTCADVSHRRNHAVMSRRRRTVSSGSSTRPGATGTPRVAATS